jgi:hypothetical protein
MQAGRVLLLFLFTFSIIQGQSPYKQSGGPAQGSLTVTVTVEPSVWLVMAPDGKQEMVVANAPDPKEAFSHAPSPKNQSKNQSKNRLKNQNTATARASTVTLPAQGPGSQREEAVQFSLPSEAKQFEVKQEIRMMNASEGGKTGSRPVKVTTVVPR